MRKLLIVLGVIVLLGLMAFSWYQSGYDQAIRLDEQVKSSWAQVENQLQRRNDLIPNLVSAVKGYAAQEKDIFTEVTRLRSQWGQSQTVNEKVENSNSMTSALSRLLLVAENYPQLKSNENFLALQSELEGTENRIAVERMRYNNAAQALNAFQRSFWGRFFAGQTGLKEAVYFKAPEAAHEVPKVSF
ncbi:MAG TPA: LemA family protein [Candidatus Omnitrophota bacterium]|nr:LemA family protein [Candidatus Omnitrophota bacterium]